MGRMGICFTSVPIIMLPDGDFEFWLFPHIEETVVGWRN